MPDVHDVRVYLAGAAAILDEYPKAVHDAISDPRSGTRLLKPFPSLHDLRAACERAYEPIAADIARERAEQSHRMLPPPDVDGAKVAAQIQEWEERIKPLILSSLQRIAPASPAPAADGRHYSRIKAELEARRARKTREGEDTAA